jgi:pimeloyl-ACP methyl ester carboxylesterase
MTIAIKNRVALDDGVSLRLDSAEVRRGDPDPMQRTFFLPPALTGEQSFMQSRTAGRLAWYWDGPEPNVDAPPLLLIHSISAASSAYDMRPLYDHYRRQRRVYALELPGFGFSERSNRTYTPRLMTDAIHAFFAQIRREHSHLPFDVIALSLSCEFVARAAMESGGSFRTLAFVSPTGFEHRALRVERPGTTQGHPWLLSALQHPSIGRRLYRLLTKRRLIRYFLARAWGTSRVDALLVEYDRWTSCAPGAEHAPLHFLAGSLFSNDSGSLYRSIRNPVWMSHATRGAFAAVPGLAALSDRPNWRIEALPAGAMPHFEIPDAFIERYDAWLAGVAHGGVMTRDESPNIPQPPPAQPPPADPIVPPIQAEIQAEEEEQIHARVRPIGI